PQHDEYAIKQNSDQDPLNYVSVPLLNYEIVHMVPSDGEFSPSSAVPQRPAVIGVLAAPDTAPPPVAAVESFTTPVAVPRTV
ncbi:hypothetical protein AB0M95_36560, partial [Sphaerisporangium sp. NPDC051017]|uniref:hypothetical protein n=1 Tax=Sphaerisporangium sp. NPDC051017 TaxID=3154636 RepID=UPI0034280B55